MEFKGSPVPSFRGRGEVKRSGDTHYPPGCPDCHWKMSLGWPSKRKSRKVPGYLGVLQMGTLGCSVSLPSLGGGSIWGLQVVVCHL